MPGKYFYFWVKDAGQEQRVNIDPGNFLFQSYPGKDQFGQLGQILPQNRKRYILH